MLMRLEREEEGRGDGDVDETGEGEEGIGGGDVAETGEGEGVNVKPMMIRKREFRKHQVKQLSQLQKMHTELFFLQVKRLNSKCWNNLQKKVIQCVKCCQYIIIIICRAL